MSYLVLARKYRPQTFDDVIGQDHITNSLKKAVEANRVHHAYLFCGPRGIGKTTCARILAKELNKVKASNQAEMLDLDSNMDIIEIDGASNRGIEEMRTLRENVKFVPMSGRYKVYIIDEVHMLTGEAFNAILKTLEEPPEHVKFIFATTDHNKLPLTVVSRCEPYYFKRIPLEMIVNKLKSICQLEGFKAEEEALYAVAKAAQGSLRDALSVVDQLISFSDGTVRTKDANSLLGVVETPFIFEMVDAVIARDCSRTLTILENIIGQGKDIKYLVQNLIEHFRHLMVMKVGGKQLEGLIDYTKAYKEALFVQSGKCTIQLILKSIDLLIQCHETGRAIESPRIALELALAKLTCLDLTPTASSQPAVKAASAPLKPAPAAPSTPVVKAAPPKPSASSGFGVTNNKGSVDIGPLASAPASEPAELTITLEEITKRWNELTFAVSQKRMSIGTYLKEGWPSAWDGQKLTVAFAPENKFDKECLDTNENIRLLSDVLSEALTGRVHVALFIDKTTDGRDAAHGVGNAVEMFHGEVVNEWHSEEERG